MDFLISDIVPALVLGVLANIIYALIARNKSRRRNKVALIIATLLSILILASLIWVKYQKPPYEITKYKNVHFDEKIRSAKSRVWAIGTKLTPIESQLVKDLIDKINGEEPFEVQLVMSDPNSDSLRQRMEDEQSRDLPDEERKARAQKELSNVQAEINKKLTWLDDLATHKLVPDKRNKMLIKCSDRYPSIAVIIIDDDLYTYSYPHGETAADAVVIVFKDYKRNSQISKLADFFERHLRFIVNEGMPVGSGKCIEPSPTIAPATGSS